MSLTDQLEAAQAEVERIKREIAHAPCAEVGHRWRHIGGRNAGCDYPDCGCSVPVHKCEVCGDCDYGDNADAEKVLAECSSADDWREEERREEELRAEARASNMEGR